MSPLQNAVPKKLVLAALGLFALAIGFHQLLWHTDSPYIFTRDDNLTYFLPLIKWHTQVVSSFHLPRMNWAHGVGWDPFMSWQAGLFYPPYLVAHWISELIHMPYALFEISFILHQMILGVVILLWGPKKISHRFLFAMSLMFAPAPFLLGINWHLYGVAHVWWVIAALWMYRENKTTQPFQTLRSKLVLFVFVTLFYSVSHPQMFVWGGILWVLWILVQYPWPTALSQSFLLLCCLLPLLPSLLLLKWVSLDVSSVNLRAMDDALALKRSVPISIPMLGALLGNLGDVVQLPLHKDTPPDGSLAGLYFQPALWIGFVIGLMKRQWLWVGSCLFILTLLGLQSFPFLTALFVGPLEGFRWTFKILILTGPLFMLWLLPHLEETFTPRGSITVLSLMGAATLMVCWQGRHIDGLYETYKTDHHAGTLIQDLEDCFTKAQIPQGARLAYVDTYEASKSHAAFLPLALSNTPSLLQRHTVHLYEPLEPDTYAEGHLNIGSFHSLGTAALTFQKDPINFTEKIRAVGGTHLIASNPSVLNSENQTVCTNSQGMPLFFKKINNAPATSFPQLNDVSPKALLTQDRSGLLFSKSKKTKTPQINSNIPIRWEKTETGWVGYPNPLDPLWGVCMVLLFLLMTFFFWRLRVTPQSSNEQTTSK